MNKISKRLLLLILFVSQNAFATKFILSEKAIEQLDPKESITIKFNHSKNWPNELTLTRDNIQVDTKDLLNNQTLDFQTRDKVNQLVEHGVKSFKYNVVGRAGYGQIRIIYNHIAKNPKVSNDVINNFIRNSGCDDKNAITLFSNNSVLIERCIPEYILQGGFLRTDFGFIEKLESEKGELIFVITDLKYFHE